MSTLDDQIKELQTKKLQADCYKKILESVESLELKTFEAVKDDILLNLNGYILKQIDNIENPVEKEDPTLDKTPGELTSDEMTILKQLAGRVTQRSDAFVQEELPKKPQVDRVDPIRFAKQYRHLDGKKVTVNTQNGPVSATVRGVDPSVGKLIVQTDTGHSIPADPANVVEQ